MNDHTVNIKDILVSVIIPVYQAEKYVKDCINSVLNQTHTNIEVILIDDGSTDNSPNICDEYSKMDSRVKVIHQKNAGPSAARNAGIDISNGDYFNFVDSDDWIAVNMYETMLTKALLNDSDITICGHYIVNNGYNQESYKIEKDILFTKECALIELVKDKTIRNYSWDKLYKKELFLQIRYPIGVRYEDFAITYKLFLLSKKILLISECFYFYRFRSNGISKQKNFQHSYDLFSACYSQYNDLKVILPKYQRFMLKKLITFALVAYNISVVKKDIIAMDIKKKHFLLDFIVKHNKVVLSENLSWNVRLRINVITRSPMLYDILQKAYVYLFSRFNRPLGK